MEAPKTKDFIKIIKGLKINDRKVLFVLPEYMNNIYISSRNLPNVKVINVNEINTYDVVNSTSLSSWMVFRTFCRDSMEIIKPWENGNFN
jgi:large subunit ribosomal protein L4